MFRAYREDGKLLLFSKTPDDFAHVMHLVMSQPPPIPYSVTHELAIAAAHNYDLHTRIFRRSEEHTSELQSLMRISYAVFCLKKNIRHTITQEFQSKTMNKIHNEPAN